MRTLLILGTDFDPHVARTMGELRRLGHDAKLIDYNRPPAISILFDEGHNQSIVIDGTPLPPDLVIWDRSKLAMNSPLGFQDVLPGETSYERRRRHHLLTQLWTTAYKCILSDRRSRYVNDPFVVHQFSLKPAQQRLARRLGLNVPDSLISSNSQDVVGFFKRSGNVIVKSASNAKVLSPADNGSTEAFMTMELRPHEIEEFAIDGKLEGPMFLQAQVDKDYEIRAFAAGESVTAFSIPSQDREVTRVDWRFGNSFLNFQEINLDASVAATLIRYLAEAGLSYGSFDLILDKHGKHWFLECNPDGQWGWLETDEEPRLSRILAERIVQLITH